MNTETAANRLATALKRFLGEYLPHQRAFSPHTILSYRDTWKLLLQFAAGRKRRVADLTVADLSPTTITAFLHHLETGRGNGAATRNVRLSAIHSFFEFFGAQHSEHLAQAQRVLSVPFKRTDHRTIDYLEAEELRAVLEGIDRSTLAGRRDYVLLALLFNTGARIQETVSLQTTDLRLATPPTVKFLGKGRNYAKVVVMQRCHAVGTNLHPTPTGICGASESTNALRLRPDLGLAMPE